MGAQPGPDLAGASSRYAIQAAIVLGERLGIAPDEVQDFLGRETGLKSYAVLGRINRCSGTYGFRDDNPHKWHNDINLNRPRPIRP